MTRRFDMIGETIQDMKSLVESQSFIKDRIESSGYKTALTLGSGLGSFKKRIDVKKAIQYEDIPGFRDSTVDGHTGELLFGHVDDTKVVAQNGRIHYYESGDMDDVVFPIRVLSGVGIDNLILTNAAGGINDSYTPGDLMIIEDHINNMGDNPLIGVQDNDLPRFPDMSEVYDKEHRDMTRELAHECELNIHSGIYVGNSGPSYETPAEIDMLDRIGGDAVGMSTVPEAIVANQYDIDVLGISTITNLAAGVSNDKLSHSEVKKTAEEIESPFNDLMSRILTEI